MCLLKANDFLKRNIRTISDDLALPISWPSCKAKLCMPARQLVGAATLMTLPAHSLSLFLNGIPLGKRYLEGLQDYHACCRGEKL